MTIRFDAIEYAQQLEAAGVSKAQAAVHARTLAHVVGNCVVLPAELQGAKSELSHAIAETETRLRAEIRSVETSLRVEIGAVEARLTRRIDLLQARLEDALKFQRWTNGLIMALLIGLYVQSYFR